MWGKYTYKPIRTPLTPCRFPAISFNPLVHPASCQSRRWIPREIYRDSGISVFPTLSIPTCYVPVRCKGLESVKSYTSRTCLSLRVSAIRSAECRLTLTGSNIVAEMRRDMSFEWLSVNFTALPEKLSSQPASIISSQNRAQIIRGPYVNAW